MRESDFVIATISKKHLGKMAAIFGSSHVARLAKKNISGFLEVEITYAVDRLRTARKANRYTNALGYTWTYVTLAHVHPACFGVVFDEESCQEPETNDLGEVGP